MGQANTVGPTLIDGSFFLVVVLLDPDRVFVLKYVLILVYKTHI